MTRINLIVLLLFIGSEFIFSQPVWYYKVPAGYLNDYFVGRGYSANSKTEASQIAFEDAIKSIMRNHTITVNLSEQYSTSSIDAVLDDKNKSEVIRKTVQELSISGESKTIKNLKEVETYFEEKDNRYEAWTLVSLPKKNPITPPSSFSPVWRSVLLPGWGQLYKEETFKGLSFMILSLGGVAGGFVFNQLSHDANHNALSSRTQARRDYYNNESKNYNTYSAVSFISAAVFYSWSLIDAIAVKQKDLYVNLNPGLFDRYQISLLLNF